MKNVCICIYKKYFVLYNFFTSQLLLSFYIARVKQFFLFYYIASYIFRGVACGSFHFFLIISSPCSNSNTRRARKQSHLRKVFPLRGCALLSRIMKLESRPICGPCGAIFFNYSCRSSTSSGGQKTASTARCRK